MASISKKKLEQAALDFLAQSDVYKEVLKTARVNPEGELVFTMPEQSDQVEVKETEEETVEVEETKTEEKKENKEEKETKETVSSALKDTGSGSSKELDVSDPSIFGDPANRLKAYEQVMKEEA